MSLIPVTNPFLRDLLETCLYAGGRKGKGGINFDELGVNDVTEILQSPNTKMDAILRDFGKQNPLEDPVIHFYELFLKLRPGRPGASGARWPRSPCAWSNTGSHALGK